MKKSSIITCLDIDLPSNSEAVYQELNEINCLIESRILRLMKIAQKRGCDVLRGQVQRFIDRLKDHPEESRAKYDHLDDNFLRSMAKQGEEHLSPNNLILPNLFERRAMLLASLA